MNALRSPFELIKASLKFFILAKRSKYPFRDKIEIFRVLLSLFYKSLFLEEKNLEVTHRIFNYKVSGYNYRTLLYLFEEIFVNKEYDFACDKPNPQIIDCGANIGMAILYFKRLYPNCSIIGFEPNPHAFRLLQKNISQNNLQQVKVENLGLTNSNGFIEFYLGDDKGSLVGSIIPNRRGSENIITVPTARVSDFIQDKKIDLMKVDIEGAENELVANLLETNLLRNSDRYIIEYHHRINKSRSAIADFLKPFEVYGFDYNIRTSFGTPGGFQDILIYLIKGKEPLAAPKQEIESRALISHDPDASVPTL